MEEDFQDDAWFVILRVAFRFRMSHLATVYCKEGPEH